MSLNTEEIPKVLGAPHQKCDETKCIFIINQDITEEVILLLLSVSPQTMDYLDTCLFSLHNLLKWWQSGFLARC